MDSRVQESRTPATFVHLTRRVGCVAIDGFEVFGDVLVRIVLQLVQKPPDRPFDRHMLMNVTSGPLRSATVVET